MNREERNRIIADSDAPASELAERLGVSRSTVYAVRREARLASDDGAGPETFNTPARNRRLLFDQRALSGLNRWGGAVNEEFQQELQDDGGVEIFTEMAVHPVAAAVLFAIEMAQRQVEWFVQPAGDDERDQKAAEFVDSCMQDMSQTWDDVISQVFTMLKYGYATCELVYKRRLGQKPPKYVADPARSRFNDGLVGWRRWQFISPRSMPAGDRWEFDDYGRVQAVKQQPAPDYVERVVPMEKALLFRTKVEWDNPEGQALTLDTPVPTPSGWTTMGDIQVGDMIYDSSGKIRYVTAKSQVWSERPVYGITFKDGSVIRADENHLWKITTTVDRQRDNDSRILPTKELFEWDKHTKNDLFYCAGMTPVLDSPESILPIDSYILGYWLGDGNRNNSSIGIHPDDFPNFKYQVERAGFRVSYDGKMQAYVSGLKVLLRAIGVLNNKHIPAPYLRASYEQRLSLLQGLMDSDGSSSTGENERRSYFYNSSPRLISQVHELLCTLGARVHKRVFMYTGSPQHVCGRSVNCNKDGYSLSFFINAPAHRLERKLKKQTLRRDGRVCGHFITSIKPNGKADTVCIEVDSPDHTFLAGESMIPTHNSILRPMYQPWYYATNLAEVEAIGAERMGTGIPVIYMGEDTKKQGASSDFDTAQDMVRNVRTDEQMGLVFTYPKMGAGAAEGRGMLFELVSPPSRGIVNFNEVITRYEQRMAMTALAQFIFLGMTKVGTQALAETTVDVFQLAITAWSDMIAGVVNRFAVPRLLALNPFQIEALPTLEHSDVAVPNLGQVAAFVNQLVGAEVLTPDERLEAYLRELAGLPGKAEVEVEVEAAEGETLEEFCERYALKTIIGALAREEETGRFARGSGAALSEEEKRAAFLGEALVSGKASPLQARQLTRLGLMERKAGKTVLTASGRELARVLGRQPRQGVKTLAALLAKRPTAKRVPKGGAGAAGKKGRKGKAKKATGGKKKKAGGKPSKEEEEEKKILEEKKDALDRLMEDGGLSPDMAGAFLLIYESENPDLAAGEYDEAIQGAMAELGLLTGAGKVTDAGKRLARALGNEDWDAIKDVLGEETADEIGELFGGPGSGHHGHKGVPGSRGGSSPSGVMRWEPGGVYDDAEARYSTTYANDVLNEGQVDDWELAEESTRSDAKARIVEDLTDATGLGEEQVNGVVAGWAQTSNDKNKNALALQQAASEEFGVPLSAWQRERIQETGLPVEGAVSLKAQLGFKSTSVTQSERRDILRHSYEMTQEAFSNAGVKRGDTVRLYRGIKTSDSASWKKGDVFDYNGNAIESWSASPNIARDFGRALMMDVPVENIVSSARTGLGCLSEGEFVILGSIPGQRVEVLD